MSHVLLQGPPSSVMTSLKSRIAQALGWDLEDTQRFSLQSLRELVRGTHPKLAHEITQQIASGKVLTPS